MEKTKEKENIWGKAVGRRGKIRTGKKEYMITLKLITTIKRRK